jgi:hypothetical protein
MKLLRTWNSSELQCTAYIMILPSLELHSNRYLINNTVDITHTHKVHDLFFSTFGLIRSTVEPHHNVFRSTSKRYDIYRRKGLSPRFIIYVYTSSLQKINCGLGSMSNDSRVEAKAQKWPSSYLTRLLLDVTFHNDGRSLPFLLTVGEI